MPFNGAGLFVRIYSWEDDAAAGLLIDSERMDTDTDDIATGLSLCITRDGQSAWLANIPAGGFKITGLGNGTVASDSLNYGQVFGTNVTFNAPMAAASPPVGDNSLLLATTAWVNGIAFSTALPPAPSDGNTYKLQNKNGVTSWTNTALDQYALNMALRNYAFSQ